MNVSLWYQHFFILAYDHHRLDKVLIEVVKILKINPQQIFGWVYLQLSKAR